MAEQLMEIDFSHNRNVAWIWLDRPGVHNALNRDLIEQLTAAIHMLPKQEPSRLYVLAGKGKSFCSGVDLGDMKASAHADYAENKADAERIGKLFEAVAQCPHPVIARVHGNVFGGAVGLVAASDLAVGAANSTFAISEVRLGIIPGLISPYLLRRMGDSGARPYMLSGRRFSGEKAYELGLLQETCALTDLDAAVERWIDELLRAGPEAQGRVKEVLRLNANSTFEEMLDMLPDKLAETRQGDEAKEGLNAFFEKRLPRWVAELEAAEDR